MQKAQLSAIPFDNEAAKLSKFLVSHVYRQPLLDSSLKVRGKLLEKWALKTFLNLGYLRALHREQRNAIKPPESLVRYIFCNASIPDGIGLYHVSGNTGPKYAGRWTFMERHSQTRSVRTKS